MKDVVLRGLKGALIGVANIIPGVSGGTMAVITGIYDRAIDAFSNFGKDKKGNILYLLPIIVGALLGIVALSWLISYLLENFPEQTNFFFMGLVLGSLPAIYTKAGEKKFQAVNLIPFVIAFAGVAVLGIVKEPDANAGIMEFSVGSGFLIVLAGVISAAAMLMPGISGSFILLLMGIYPTVIHAVKTMDLPYLLLYLVGAAAGMAAFAKLVNYLLKNHHGLTYFGIIGLVLGSVFALYPGFSFSIMGLVSIGAFLIGGGLALIFGGGKKDAAA